MIFFCIAPTRNQKILNPKRSPVSETSAWNHLRHEFLDLVADKVSFNLFGTFCALRHTQALPGSQRAYFFRVPYYDFFIKVLKS